ncbi:MAG: hypothetical protein Q7U91_05140 [Sideroxyarcus sp.]|nr:hypothetical protein [Sideroxyarcus sp.]
MQFGPINELILHGVFDRGVPNQERIVLKTQGHLNLAAFGLLVTAKQYGATFPLPDHFFWFGETLLDAGTWVYVYTGPGLTRMTQTMQTNEPAYVLHWNRDNVMFHQEALFPALIRIDAAAIDKTEFLPLLPNHS